MDKFLDRLPWYLMSFVFGFMILCGILIKINEGIKQISLNF